MRTFLLRLSFLPSACAIGMFMTGCATTPPPAGSAPAAPKLGKIVSSNTLKVRTTAYLGTRNAIGGRPLTGKLTSAAADWSEFPLGTRFRVRETGKSYIIDDYGSALVGNRTIDLYKTNPRDVYNWGVRWVTIDVTEWGSPRKSLEVLAPRTRRWHTRQMIAALRKQVGPVPEKFKKKRM